MHNLSWIRLTMRLRQWSKQSGFDVWLVNARDTRNLPGRKSDVQESQWFGHERAGMIDLSWTRLTVRATPVVTAYVWVIEEVVPADAGDPRLADLLARTGRIR